MKTATIIVIGAAILFAFNGVISKTVLDEGLDPLRLAEFRSSAAFLIMIAVCLVRGGSWGRVSAIPSLLAYGFGEFFLVPVTYFFAIRSLPLGIALLIEYIAPVLVTVWARLKHKVSSSTAAWTGLTLSVLGLALVGEVWAKPEFDLVGVGFAFAAAGALAVSFIAGEAASTQLGSLKTMLWSSGVGAVTAAVARPWWSFRPHVLSGNTHGFPIWFLCMDIVILGTIVPYLLLIEGLRRISAMRVGVLMTLEPASAVWFAWVLLDEHLEAWQILGGVVVLAGVIIAEAARGGSHHPVGGDQED